MSVIDNYKKAYESLQQELEQVQKNLISDYGTSGTSYSKSTTRKYEEAQSFRFNSGACYDIYSPSIITNSQNLIELTKNHEVQSYLDREGCVYKWLRAEELLVNQSNERFDYTSKKHDITSGVLNVITSSYNGYSDYYKLQIGQDKGPLREDSNVDDEKYGVFVINAQENVTISSSKKDITLEAKEKLLGGGDTVQLTASKTAMLSSKVSTLVTGLDVTVSSTADLNLSSKANVRVTSLGTVYIGGSLVSVGPGGFFEGSMDLNLLSGLGIISLASKVISIIQDPMEVFSLLSDVNIVSSILGEDAASMLTGLTEIFGGDIGQIATSVFSAITSGNWSDLIGIGLGALDGALSSALEGSRFGDVLQELGVSSISDVVSLVTGAISNPLGLAQEFASKYLGKLGGEIGEAIGEAIGEEGLSGVISDLLSGNFSDAIEGLGEFLLDEATGGSDTSTYAPIVDIKPMRDSYIPANQPIASNNIVNEVPTPQFS